MTMKEFSRKYRIPYQVIYDAHFNMPCYNPSRRKNQEWDEQELFEAVANEIAAKIGKYTNKTDMFTEYLANLGKSN